MPTITTGDEVRLNNTDQGDGTPVALWRCEHAGAAAATNPRARAAIRNLR